MTTLPKLSRNEWAWVYLWLTEAGKKMPRKGKNAVAYNATNWDGDDLYHTAREGAIYSRSEVWKAVEERARIGAWPKAIEAETAFWLRARWEEVSKFSEEVLATADDSSLPHATPPADALGALKAVLLDFWDEVLVDSWLTKHLGDCTYFESYGADPESHAQLSSMAERAVGWQIPTKMKKPNKALEPTPTSVTSRADARAAPAAVVAHL